jgi:hypothetical protein
MSDAELGAACISWPIPFAAIVAVALACLEDAEPALAPPR